MGDDKSAVARPPGVQWFVIHNNLCLSTSTSAYLLFCVTYRYHSKDVYFRCHFDANLYSEPLAIMNMLWDYEKTHNQNGWAWHYSASAPRLRRLLTTRNSLRNRVADFTGIDSETLRMEKPPVQMEHAKITLLRIIQVWVFSETMIEAIQASNAVDDAVTLSFKGDNITALSLGAGSRSGTSSFCVCQQGRNCSKRTLHTSVRRRQVLPRPFPPSIREQIYFFGD